MTPKQLGPEEWCDGCGCNPCDCANNHLYAGGDDYPPPCTNPGGHDFQCTGTAYGGDDERWHGEGRCLCVYCGADGDA